MRLLGFDIANFKGIRDARIRFSENDTARVHTLVGLNESGKTTLLEALHSFSPDAETQLVVRSARNIDEQREQWIPKDKISIFTGDISVAAHVAASVDDWQDIATKLTGLTGLDLDLRELPEKFIVRRVHSYRNGDFQRTFTEVVCPIMVKSGRATIFKAPDVETRRVFENIVWESLPTIAYYPTFVFDFPKRIYLTGRDDSPRNRFYRRLFQDILDYDGNGYTIEDSIIARIHRIELRGFWEAWFRAFVGTSEEDKVQQVVSRAGRVVTNVVFSKWNEVFGESVGAKEIEIQIRYEQGSSQVGDDGAEEEPVEHDAYIRFRIKDGTNSYSVEDRSLGFRWFFSFLLFTQFRIRREGQRPTVFLFDEPASNLHAAAQIKLLESFPAIARYPHRLLYSTHSHYMVEPRWLEQAYIVFDRSSGPDTAIIDESVKPDSVVDIQAVPYRSFIADRPMQTSYFQPILDTLEVKPSRFDYLTGGLIVEGKSDYYFLRFAAMIVDRELGPIFPATGSGTMGALVSLHRGWGLPVRVLFDSDQGGSDGKKNLVSDFSLSNEESTRLGDLSPKLQRIEDVLSKTDQDKLAGSSEPRNKSILLRRIQELLAAGERPSLTKETTERMRTLVGAVAAFMKESRRP